MDTNELLNLSVGDEVPDSRLGSNSYCGEITIQGKPVNIGVTSHAVEAVTSQAYPVLIELELYFSCLVRKQVRFRTLIAPNQIPPDYTPVLPGLFASFRAICTQECKVSEVIGKPPIEAMPVKKPGMFVPDWIKIDFRATQWRGDYGFNRTL